MGCRDSAAPQKQRGKSWSYFGKGCSRAEAITSIPPVRSPPKPHEAHGSILFVCRLLRGK
jgi:hypothetical protein